MTLNAIGDVWDGVATLTAAQLAMLRRRVPFRIPIRSLKTVVEAT